MRALRQSLNPQVGRFCSALAPIALKKAAPQIVMFCAALSEDREWPLYKLKQLHAEAQLAAQDGSDPIEVHMLAFTKHLGLIEGHVFAPETEGAQPKFTVQRIPLDRSKIAEHAELMKALSVPIEAAQRRWEGYADLNELAALDEQRFNLVALRDFLNRWHDEQRGTYFVYGGHGMGDYLDLDETRLVLQTHQLAQHVLISNRKGSEGLPLRYKGILFDACCMSSLDTVYFLRKHTEYIAACEGFMWVDDGDLERHMLTGQTARDLCSTKVAVQDAFVAAGERYRENVPWSGDYSLLNTAHAEELYYAVHETFEPDNSVFKMIYSRFCQVDEATVDDFIEFGESLPEFNTEAWVLTELLHDPALVRTFMRFPGLSIFPSEVDEQHILDLGAVLEAMKASLMAENPHEIPQHLQPMASHIRRIEELIQKTVLRHDAPTLGISPQTPAYGTPLTGLSMTAHELSDLSVAHEKEHLAGYHYHEIAERIINAFFPEAVEDASEMPFYQPLLDEALRQQFAYSTVVPIHAVNVTPAAADTNISSIHFPPLQAGEEGLMFVMNLESLERNAINVNSPVATYGAQSDMSF